MLRKTAVLSLFIGALSTLPVAHAVPNQSQQTAAQTQEVTVNLNTASVAELSAALTGVGTKRAEAIIALREKLGGFSDINQLMQVKGIGPRMLEINKAKMKL
ncbi:hypothetical protein IDAT_01600 [Pseudidiomarina atlantica]|jgi:competence protein ComEA|uniref:Competence protein ComEA n=1 Tax=Pseudidiomarina atlantica TaxID=1517416 RepID=A0A094IQ54_9GAMM|nr:helix-hairpin-helix domain-containing protein [Pseudidiomarina atlantica]KFZ29815.1 hypothetical protein IDAT_01600 [Pseudidiomarina atlantica]